MPRANAWGVDFGGVVQGAARSDMLKILIRGKFAAGQRQLVVESRQ
jgi:hypothetical protein